MSDGGKSEKPSQAPVPEAQPAPEGAQSSGEVAAGSGMQGVLAQRSDAVERVRYRMTGGTAGTAPAGQLAAERRSIIGAAAGRIMRKASGAPVGGTQIPKGSGSPLPSDVKSRMEPKLGADLSGVRLHTGGESQKAAAGFGARAFTVGSDVHFNSGQFAPGTKEGDKLIAHELTHVVQGHSAGSQRVHRVLEGKEGEDNGGGGKDKKDKKKELKQLDHNDLREYWNTIPKDSPLTSFYEYCKKVGVDGSEVCAWDDELLESEYGVAEPAMRKKILAWRDDAIENPPPSVDKFRQTVIEIQSVEAKGANATATGVKVGSGDPKKQTNVAVDLLGTESRVPGDKGPQTKPPANAAGAEQKDEELTFLEIGELQSRVHIRKATGRVSIDKIVFQSESKAESGTPSNDAAVAKAPPQSNGGVLRLASVSAPRTIGTVNGTIHVGLISGGNLTVGDPGGITNVEIDDVLAEEKDVERARTLAGVTEDQTGVDFAALGLGFAVKAKVKINKINGKNVSVIGAALNAGGAKGPSTTGADGAEQKKS